MRLENEHSKYFDHEYPENHPQIIICGDNSQEIQDLLYAIDSFFYPIENSLKVKYECQFQVKYNKVYLDIGNQYSKKAVKAVQNAKKELKNFIDNYNKHSEPTPVWEVVLSTAVTTLIVVLTLIFNLSTKTWKGSHTKKLLIAAIFAIVVDRTSIFQKFQEFQLSSLLQHFLGPFKPSVDPSKPSVDPSKPSLKFPEDRCGDELPGDLTAYPVNVYGVFIEEYTERNLNEFKSHFCKDALVQKNQIKIQVASFLGEDRANIFKKVLENDEIFKKIFRGVKVEVGERKKIEWDHDFGSKELPNSQVNWEVIDKDPKGLNCRMPQQYQGTFMDSIDAPEIPFKNNNINDWKSWTVMNKFKTGQKLRAVTTKLGNNIILLYKKDEPWILVESQLGDLSDCFVRADSKYIAPIKEDQIAE